MGNKIYNRFIEKIILDKLRTIGAIHVTGPKFCGKTTICMKFQKSFIKLNTTKITDSIAFSPEVALVGDTPHLIDEWQAVPDIWNYVKNSLDEQYEFGKFILTGSSTPADTSGIFHSGAGRITTIKMKTLSLSESEESTNEVSIKFLFNNKLSKMQAHNPKTYDDVLFYMCRGGWPLSLQGKTRLDSLQITANYCKELFSFESSNNETFRNKKSSLLKILLKSCARNISAPVKASTIMNDIIERQERSTFDRKTFDAYYSALIDLYILDPMESWTTNIRSKTVMTNSDIMHFSDTSIACHILNATPENLKLDRNTAGFLFEDFVVRDLSIYASLLGGKIKHYRDGNGRECDAIITLPDGKWAAIQIKLGGKDLEEEGCDQLTSFINAISQSDTYTPPSFCMVVTATGQPRISDEGYYIVPITCLTK